MLAGVIVGTDGLPVLLKGVIWSGFENGTMVNGLQVRPACRMCSSSCTAATHLHMLGLRELALLHREAATCAPTSAAPDLHV